MNWLQLANLDNKLTKAIVQQAISIYNQQRPHLSCWLNTPQEMHQQQMLTRRTYKKQKPSS